MMFRKMQASPQNCGVFASASIDYHTIGVWFFLCAMAYYFSTAPAYGDGSSLKSSLTISMLMPTAAIAPCDAAMMSWRVG